MKKCISLILTVVLFMSVVFTEQVSANTSFMKIYGLNLTYEGDSTLLNMDGNWLLIDTGSAKASDELVNKLKNTYGITKLDLYISHLHYDHYGAYKALSENFKINKLYLPDYNVIAPEHEYNNSILNKIYEALPKAKVTLLKKGSVFSYGATTATVLGPVGEYTPQEADINSETYKNDRYGEYLNNYSLTTKFVCGNYSFLTCGDIEVGEETALVNTYKNGELKADVLKLSHHGLGTSNKTSFLQAVDADYFYALNGTYTDLKLSSNGNLIRRTYTSIKNASEFGIPYLVADEGKDFCALFNNGGISVYKGSISEQNKFNEWVNVLGSTGQKNDEYYTYYIRNGKILTGVNKIGSKTYYFGNGGCMVKGSYSNGVYKEQRKMSDGFRAFKQTGEMYLGFATINGYLRYYDKKTGIRKNGVVGFGLASIEGNKYTINENGVIYRSGWKKYNGNYQYFEYGTGKMKTGWFKIGTTKYYLNKTNGVRTLGLKKIGKSTYYFVKKNSAGYLYKGGWKKFKKKYRYFSKSSGKMYKGWKKINGKKYYFNSKGYRVTGKQKIGKKTYRFTSSGVLKK